MIINTGKIEHTKKIVAQENRKYLEVEDGSLDLQTIYHVVSYDNVRLLVVPLLTIFPTSHVYIPAVGSSLQFLLVDILKKNNSRKRYYPNRSQT